MQVLPGLGDTPSVFSGVPHGPEPSHSHAQPQPHPVISHPSLVLLSPTRIFQERFGLTHLPHTDPAFTAWDVELLGHLGATVLPATLEQWPLLVGLPNQRPMHVISVCIAVHVCHICSSSTRPPSLCAVT